MNKQKSIKAENIRSEAFMCDLFGMTPKYFRQLAKRENFRVAHISNKVRLYDMQDVVRIFGKYTEEL